VAPVVFYGGAARNEVRFARPPEPGEGGMRFTLVDAEGEHEVRLGVYGEQNATNALAVWAAARRDGLAPAAVADALARFRGVKRRQELVGDAGGIAVIDDFAHHPTAVAKTLAALRGRFPGRRLIAAFEPRSLTAGRAFFLDGYRAAFAHADQVLFAPIFHRDRLSAEDRLDLESLADELGRRGTPAAALPSVDAVIERLLAEARPGDVIASMSSGSFSGLPQRVATALTGRALSD
jgi:UDP-N-acetylmuramate: L-alanyl-gamma-D-glutamyl-meso-diaminopimelate ligase